MKHFRNLVAIAALAMLVGCSSPDEVATAPPPSSPTVMVPTDGVDRSKTIEFDGVQYTCGQALQRPNQICEEDIQLAFNKWADNLLLFVNDPVVSTGSWGSASFEDVAMGGLVACDFASNDNAFGFTQYMKRFRDGQYGGDEAAVSTLYIGATTSLCPEV